MKKKLLLIFVLSACFLWSEAVAQQDSYGISFSGFVKTDALYDSRQTVNFREGHFLLYPSNVLLDENLVDINDASSFNILSIQTRLHGRITGPTAFGAKTGGVVEAEFFGTSDGDINGLRLRHAYAVLDWNRTSLLVGQTWHPMFIAEVFPGVVSFNTGVPFQPFSRNPQVRFTQRIGDFKVTAVAASQRDFSSPGPGSEGSSVQSSMFLRNSVMPNLHLQAQYASSGHILGAGVDYKKLTPRLRTTKNIATDEVIGTLSAVAYVKADASPFTIKAQGVLGDNLADLLMLGGYAATTIDEITGVECYTAIRCYSMWGELSYGETIEFALFAGYSRNLGAQEEISGAYYSRGGGIDHIYRISPRIQWSSGATRLATELEYTSAAYGLMNAMGMVKQARAVANVRLLVALLYFF